MNRDILRKAIDTYGVESQMMMCIEEAAELIQAINKYFRAAKSEDVAKEFSDMIGEIADVQIVLEQMRMIFGEGLVEIRIKEKIDRLEERLERKEMVETTKAESFERIIEFYRNRW